MMDAMARWRIDPRIQIGSVRLQTTQLDRMLEFYLDILGFEITYRDPSRVFLSAGGLHPHLMLTAEASPAPSRFGIRFPDRETLGETYRSISGQGLEPERAVDDGIRESLYLRDPEGNEVELYRDRPREEWQLDSQGAPLSAKPLDLEALAATAAPSASGEGLGSPNEIVSLSPPTRARLSDVRLRLLNLHKVLLDDAKSAYELDRGRVGSSASLLQLVINDPWFAWLHPLSELVVRIDEALQPEAPATEADGLALLDEVERLLSPGAGTEDFAQRYYEALQRQPAVIVAHAEVRRILKQTK